MATMNRMRIFSYSALTAALLAGCAPVPSQPPRPQAPPAPQSTQQATVKHEYLVSHILCRSEADANSALERIRAGVPFDTVAAAFSIDANRNNGVHIPQ